MNRFEGEVLEQREGLTADQSAHIGRVTTEAVGLMQTKYQAGQLEHGGNCWEKPGMLAHALDESADLSVYLWTLREQMIATVRTLRAGSCTPEQAADEIERWLTK